MCGRGHLDVPGTSAHRMQSGHQARSPAGNARNAGLLRQQPSGDAGRSAGGLQHQRHYRQKPDLVRLGKPTATAKGSAEVDLCAYEDCLWGEYISVPFEMTVSKIVQCSKNTRVYSTLRYMFTDGSPFRGVRTKGRTSAHDQAVPPANQTVSLTC